ncbi:SDR family oxidoreductase [Roseomonas gilardii]|uniref:SDR family oxidoreductase n=1 Tax=Roseomonas gilardii TaxID=257708 RepID=UPI0011A9AD30|nr:SDR family oxidoreductase [Roseomonas gilardii]
MSDVMLPGLLSGRTILVTGAARGLGLVLATALRDCGARLVLADRDAEAGAAAAERLGARFVPVDLADPASIRAMAADLSAQEGALDGLVNNAAIATGIGGVTFEEIEQESWDRVMAVNVRGTWLVIRALAPLLRRGRDGRIVNVASDTALWGAPRLLSYTASKGAVISMTRSLARELGPEGIGIAAVAPGILRTESTEYVPPARHRLYEEGRAVPGVQEATDIAPTVAFLLTPGALALTGQVLPVNRGFVFT